MSGVSTEERDLLERSIGIWCLESLGRGRVSTSLHMGRLNETKTAANIANVFIESAADYTPLEFNWFGGMFDVALVSRKCLTNIVESSFQLDRAFDILAASVD